MSDACFLAPEAGQRAQQPQLGGQVLGRALHVVHPLAPHWQRHLHHGAVLYCMLGARCTFIGMCMVAATVHASSGAGKLRLRALYTCAPPRPQPGRTQASRARRLHLRSKQALLASAFSAQPRAASAARASGNGPISTNTRAPGARPSRRRQAARLVAHALCRAVSALRLRRYQLQMPCQRSWATSPRQPCTLQKYSALCLDKAILQRAE